MNDLVTAINSRLSKLPSSAAFTAEFVEMDGNQAVVNIGDNPLTLPCDGFYPPRSGMTVRVQKANGRYWVTGPATTRNPVGTVLSVSIDGTKLSVDVDDEVFSLPFFDSITAPTAGDMVQIDWSSGQVTGRLATENIPDVKPEPKPKPTPKPFTGLLVRAGDSGRYQNSWWGNDPWISSSNAGAWFYGDRIKAAIKGATITKMEIYLPLISQLGNCAIGTHPYAWKPAGEPIFSSLVNLSNRSGWVQLPTSWAPYIAAGGRGIGGPATSGYNRWRGVASDPLSGALRFAGTR